MEDRQIVNLYLMRQEAAIKHSQIKYGALLRSVALAILSNNEDAGECENDTYLTAWNKIPPDKPCYLGAYLSKITRFLALDRYQKANAKKRGGETTPLEELYDCLPSRETVEGQLEEGALKEAINRFLRGLPAEKRCVFIKRYFHMASIKEIARDYHMSEGKVKTILHRTRLGLKALLEKEELL
jgi:RNA polymerase sigma-70 factor (ECF subfamily)